MDKVFCSNNLGSCVLLKDLLISFLKESSSEYLISEFSEKYDLKYFQLVKDKKWKNVNFHFEVQWHGNLNEVKSVRLDAHLEPPANKDNGGYIMNMFAINDMPRGTKNPLKTVNVNYCDFSSFEKAKDTVLKIIEIINYDDDFREYSDITDKIVVQTD